MDKRIQIYLSDILQSIIEIELATEARSKEYRVFLDDFVYRKFIERNIEIIGEAVNRILKIVPDIAISSARQIVDTRNYVIHAYDSIRPELLWAIVVNHLPKLKSEVETILASFR